MALNVTWNFQICDEGPNDTARAADSSDDIKAPEDDDIESIREDMKVSRLYFDSKKKKKKLKTLLKILT